MFYTTDFVWLDLLLSHEPPDSKRWVTCPTAMYSSCENIFKGEIEQTIIQCLLNLLGLSGECNLTGVPETLW